MGELRVRTLGATNKFLEGEMPASQQYQAGLDAYTEGKDPVVMQSDTHRIIAELIGSVPEQILRQRSSPDEWSVGEILAHLAEDELVSGWRYRQMVENSGCALSAFDQDEWARLGDYGTCNLSDSLQSFRLLREANLRMFSRLTADEWEAFGLHAERGKAIGTVIDAAEDRWLFVVMTPRGSRSGTG